MIYDFDIDLAKTDRYEPWRVEENKKFRQWLIDNGFNPEDKTLTIGHPKVGQINMQRSFDAVNDEQKVVLCTIHENVKLCFTIEEMLDLNELLDQSLHMIEVNKLLMN